MSIEFQQRSESSATNRQSRQLEARLRQYFHGDADAPTRFAEDVAEPLEAPARIDRYLLNKLVGKGGFGMIYAAYDPQIHREVAIKIPRAVFPVRSKLSERFDREIKAVATLHHPNILPVLDAGRDGHIPFLVLPLCIGPDLGQWVAQQNGNHVPVALAVNWVKQLALAVEHAHQRGIIHRDIKPSNILLDTRGSPEDPMDWQPKLTDFGLVKAIHDDEASAPLTVSGDSLGTPEYMAPEQFDADRNKVTISTDIHGLGVILHELLFGVSPYSGQNRARKLVDLLDDSPVILPTSRKSIPRDLLAVLEKCLAKNPLERYASATELVDDLDRFQKGLSTRARPLSTAGRVWRWCKRHPTAAVMMCTIVGLLLALAINVLRNQATLQESVLEKSNAIDAAQLKEASHLLDQGKQEIALEVLNNLRSHQQVSPLVFRLLMHRIWEQPLVLLAGHHDRITDILPSHDGKFLLTQGWDSSAQLWNLQTGAARPLLADHEYIFLGPMRREPVMVNYQSQACVWNPARPVDPVARHPLPQLPQGYQDCVCVSSADQQVIAVTHPSGGLHIVDRRTGQTIQRSWPWSSTKSECVRAWCSPAGRWLMAQNPEHQLHLWTLPDGQYAGPCAPSINYPVFEMRFNDEKDECYIGDYRGHVVHLRLTDRQATPRLFHGLARTRFSHGTLNRQMTIAWDTLEWDHIYCGTHNGEILSCQLATGREIPLARLGSEVLFVIMGSPGELLCADKQHLYSIDITSQSVQKQWLLPGDLLSSNPRAFLDLVTYIPQQRALVFAGNDGRIALWRFEMTVQSEIIHHPREEAHVVAFSPDSSILATGGDDGLIHLFDTSTRKLLCTLRGHESLVSALVFTPDGKTLFSASYDGEEGKGVRRWNVETGVCEQVYLGADTRVKCLAFSASQRLLYAGCNKGFLLAWREHEVNPIRRLRAHDDHIDSIFLAPDEKTLYTGGEDRFIKIWEEPSGKFLQQLADQQQLWKIRIQKNHMVSAGNGRHISVWSTNLRKLERRFRDPDTTHRALALSPDGDTIVTGGASGPIRFWQTRTGLELARFDVGRDVVFSLDFSPNGHYLAAACKSGRILFYAAK